MVLSASYCIIILVFLVAMCPCTSQAAHACANLTSLTWTATQWHACCGDTSKNEAYEWLHVNCTVENGHIVGLSLQQSPSFEFTDNPIVLPLSIPSALGTTLRNLTVSSKYIEGAMWENCSEFKQLRYLNLSNTGIGSVLPKGCKTLICDNLLELDISNTFLRPATSEESGEKLDCRFRTLQVLRMANTQFNLELPQLWSESVQLRELVLDHSPVSGTIPLSWSRLSNLEVFSARHCLLRGDIQVMKNWRSLRRLDVSGNEITSLLGNDSFPADHQLEFVDVSSNAIPDVRALLNLRHLKVLDVSGNPLVVELLPNAVLHLPALETLRMSNVRLSSLDFLWRYETNTSNVSLPYLTTLDMSRNRIGGLLPADFQSRFPKLITLNVSSNELIGELPFLTVRFGYYDDNHLLGVEKAFGDVTEVFSARSNYVTGSLPVHPDRGFPNLRVLDMSWNELSGAMPSRHLYPSLSTLSLRGNKYTFAEFLDPPPLAFFDIGENSLREFPARLSAVSSLVTLLVDYNSISTVPWLDLRALTKLTDFDASFNPLGNNYWPQLFLPSIKRFAVESIGLATPLQSVPVMGNTIQYINLAGNALSGSIPDHWKDARELKNLVELNLSSNRLSGTIPDWLVASNQTFNVTILDVSHNMLGGTLPQTFRSMTSLSVGYNSLTGSLDSLFMANLRWTSLLLGPNLFESDPLDLSDDRYEIWVEHLSLHTFPVKLKSYPILLDIIGATTPNFDMNILSGLPLRSLRIVDCSIDKIVAQSTNCTDSTLSASLFSSIEFINVTVNKTEVQISQFAIKMFFSLLSPSFKPTSRDNPQYTEDFSTCFVQLALRNPTVLIPSLSVAPLLLMYDGTALFPNLRVLRIVNCPNVAPLEDSFILRLKELQLQESLTHKNSYCADVDWMLDALGVGSGLSSGWVKVIKEALDYPIHPFMLSLQVFEILNSPFGGPLLGQFLIPSTLRVLSAVSSSFEEVISFDAFPDSLEFLDLSYNRFSGFLPSINHAQLTVLRLSNTSFELNSASLKLSLPALVELRMSNVSGFKGPIPPDFFGLRASHLSVLDFSFNRDLTSRFPAIGWRPCADTALHYCGGVGTMLLEGTSITMFDPVDDVSGVRRVRISQTDSLFCEPYLLRRLRDPASCLRPGVPHTLENLCSNSRLDSDVSSLACKELPAECAVDLIDADVSSGGPTLRSLDGPCGEGYEPRVCWDSHRRTLQLRANQTFHLNLSRCELASRTTRYFLSLSEKPCDQADTIAEQCSNSSLQFLCFRDNVLQLIFPEWYRNSVVHLCQDDAPIAKLSPIAGPLDRVFLTTGRGEEPLAMFKPGLHRSVIVHLVDSYGAPVHRESYINTTLAMSVRNGSQIPLLSLGGRVVIEVPLEIIAYPHTTVYIDIRIGHRVFNYSYPVELCEPALQSYFDLRTLQCVDTCPRFQNDSACPPGQECVRWSCPVMGACPDGTRCNGTAIICTQVGYWRGSGACVDTNQSQERYLIADMCPLNVTAGGGCNSSDHSRCRDGYDGPLCLACTADHVLTESLRCQKCPSRVMSIVILICFCSAVLLWIFAVVFTQLRGAAFSILKRETESESMSDLSLYLKLFLGVIQTSVVLDRLNKDIEWPGPIRYIEDQLIDFLGILDMVYLRCIIPSLIPYKNRLLTFASVFIFFMLINVVALAVLYFKKRQNTCFEEVKERWLLRSSSLIVVNTVFVYVMYSPLVLMVAYAFYQTPMMSALTADGALDTTPQWVLIMDSDVRTAPPNAQYDFVRWTAYATGICGAVGYPVSVIVSIILLKRWIPNCFRVKAILGIYITGLKPYAYWFDMIRVGRNGLTLLTSAFYHPHTRFAVCALLAFLELLLTVQLRPYSSGPQLVQTTTLACELTQILTITLLSGPEATWGVEAYLPSIAITTLAALDYVVLGLFAFEIIATASNFLPKQGKFAVIHAFKARVSAKLAFIKRWAAFRSHSEKDPALLQKLYRRLKGVEHDNFCVKRQLQNMMKVVTTPS